MSDKQTILKKEYKKIFKDPKNRPDWAVKRSDRKDQIIHPSIPFIGKNYKNRRLLLYASAENLSHYNEKGQDYLNKSSFTINRHRQFYETHKNDINEDKPFPDIHIAPVNNGELLVVTAYILKILDNPVKSALPVELLEDIAVGNFGKFSMTGKKNIDYAGSLSKLRYSIEYVKKDLNILKPEILIIPKTIYNHKEIKQIIDSIVPNCYIIPIYQINPRVVNCHIASEKRMGFKLKKTKEIDEIINDWHAKLSKGVFRKKSNENFYSVYSYLDKVIKNALST